MALVSVAVTVTTADTTLFAAPSTASVTDPVPVVVYNNDATATLFIGGVGVTTAAGLPVGPGKSFLFALLNSDTIHGISTTSINVRVMAGRQ